MCVRVCVRVRRSVYRAVGGDVIIWKYFFPCLAFSCSSYFLLRHVRKIAKSDYINPLNAELNPTCHLLALLGTHHIIHVGRDKG